jgi:cyclase
VRIIDLSSPIDARGFEPDQVRHTILSPADGARHMRAGVRGHLGMDFDAPAVLPDGEFLSLDTLTVTTHTGTHVDAPSHYGSRAAYGVPKNVDEVPLDWFVRPGCLLDMSETGVGVIGADQVKAELDRIGYRPQPLDIVLVRTGADRWSGTQRYFTDFAGLDGPAVHFLLDMGVRVIGTDAFSLDAPFGHIIREYRRTRDPAVLWPAHFAGREREYCQLERLANLHTLPSASGFTVVCPPVKIARAGAGWTRALALVSD